MRAAGRLSRSRYAFILSALLMVLGTFTLAEPAKADAVHGIGFFKGCTSPTTVGQKTSCNFTITNTSDPDDLTISSLVDVVHGAAGDDNSGNIIPTLTWSFSGGASCNATKTVCTLPTGSKMSTSPAAVDPPNNVGPEHPFLFHTVTGADAD